VQPLAPDRVSFAPGSRPTPLVDVERTADTTRYQRLVEGAWVVYREPWYYLFYSGDNCCGPRAHYAVMVARSRSATGPFETLAAATGRPQSVILERNAAGTRRATTRWSATRAATTGSIYHASTGTPRVDGW
jgi:arabinan endo-1,5-alpha-L-arabinosidase